MKTATCALAAVWTFLGGSAAVNSSLAQDLTQLCGEAPQPIVRVKPRYPEAGLERQITGWVAVEFSVGNNGSPLNIAVIESSNRVFDQPALLAIGKWRYLPCAAGAVIGETLEFTRADLEEQARSE